MKGAGRKVFHTLNPAHHLSLHAVGTNPFDENASDLLQAIRKEDKQVVLINQPL